MSLLKTGVIASSHRKREARLPIHPKHLGRIPENLRRALTLEKGYGKSFGLTDENLASWGVSFAPREELLRESDLVLLPKPVARDLKDLREGAVLWGWPHCVQQHEVTQIAVDRRQTLIAFEAMYAWRRGCKDLHIFYKNNELAGYCAVIHALELVGRDGLYGARQRGAILSHGSVSRGAIHALRGRGFTDLRVYTQRPAHLVADQIPGCRYRRMANDPDDDNRMIAKHSGGKSRRLIEDLAEVDLVVNGILQDTDDPVMFFGEDLMHRLRPGSLIIDVSCDEGMGFPFARPTTFDEPMLSVGHIRYYAVDHTPTYLWDAASWEISKALLPYLPTMMNGSKAWQTEETIRKAIEIQDGKILNPKILSFQNREAEYPHCSRTRLS